MTLYKDFLQGDAEFEQEYYENLQLHLKEILKYLLGYEENH
jgi:hypothetical protein